jgi:hypothetical protein
MPDDQTTYYGRPQLKAAPFSKPLVGGYIFLAGLSGGAQLLAGLLDLAQGRSAAPAVRRGRLLALLAPTLGAACLVADLHTPQRFYNMLRVFKRTSPMSIGTWVLTLFTGASFVAAGADLLADRFPRSAGWLRSVGRAAQVPAAAAGGELGTYTAALLSATSTPLWASAPRGLAVKFGASSIASAAAALRLPEGNSRLGRDLDRLAALALAVELAADAGNRRQHQRDGIPPAATETAVAAFGTLLPLAALVGSFVLPRQSRLLSGMAALGILGGSLAMRIGTLAAGDATAADPAVSLRFAGGRQVSSSSHTTVS